MDRALKERLIGAVVLVGIGAWLIPWVLDGPPAGGDEPAPLELPVPDEPVPLRTQTIQLDQRDAPAARESRPQPAPAETSAGQAAREASDAVAARTPPAATPPPAGTQTQPAEREAAPEQLAEERASTDGAAETAAREARAAAEEEARAAAAQEAAAAAAEARTAAAPPAAGDWLVQLGSFGQEENARRLAERVSGHGHAPTITNVRSDGRLMHRVRVGPFETRRQAEDAVAALSAEGFVGQVVGAD